MKMPIYDDMMATTEKTPIWLDLKKEDIDDNFAKLQVYLRECDEKGGKDTFYVTTIRLFRGRIADLLHDLSERPVYADEQERQQLANNVNMLATYLLADSEDSLAMTAYTHKVSDTLCAQKLSTDTLEIGASVSG